MKLDEFINKYIKTKVDFDGAFGAQCVDLFRQYCKDVLNIPHTGAVEGAKDLFLKYSELPLEIKYFKKYQANCPECGDVAVWNSNLSNKFGHVAIIISVIDENNLLVFEQDGFRQDGAKFATRSMNNMLGVLRFRGKHE